jgi:hypothetical protein
MSAVNRAVPTILLWNPPAWAPAPGHREECEITHDRARLPAATAVVFHVPTLGSALRLPRPAGQVWVAWSMESAAMYPALSEPEFLKPFDLTMTYRLDSDVPAPYFEPGLRAALRAPQEPKIAPAPAAIFISNAAERSGRTAYLRELMRHLAVDSYGRCLNNRRLAEDRGRATLDQVIRRYRFTLAFENSITPDYVTEKFFAPLAAGSVPVYLGAPNVAAFAPGEHCYLDVRDFAGPRELAAHLKALAADDVAYNRLLAWKRRPFRDEFARLYDAYSRPPFSRLGARLTTSPLSQGRTA